MRKLIIASILIWSALCATGQFVPQPLNYPGAGYWPSYISISDKDHVWIGTTREFHVPYSVSVKTTDGGESWIFYPIPVQGDPICTSICEWDTNTCFFVFTDISAGGGTIWKTLDGGNTWANLVTTQFTGGFVNFYHAFSADTGVAMGDPTNGYFEIQVTNDGGTSWSRIPSTNLPPPVTGEMGFTDAYSAVGNSIWFSTNKGRCFRSIDKGLTWDVTTVVEATEASFNVCFSTQQKGVFWKWDDFTNNVAVTNDGGITWNTAGFPPGYAIMFMSSVGGFDGGFVATAWQNYTDVFFTPDLFSNIVQIGSDILSIGSVRFLDETTGWIGGGESGSNEILKFTGILNGLAENIRSENKLTIIPNPTSVSALLKLPGNTGKNEFVLRITDMSGKVLFRQPGVSTSEWTTLDATRYPNGVYVIEIIMGSITMSRGLWMVNH